MVAYPCPYPADWRGIRVSTSSVRLVAGGKLVREIPFAGAGHAFGLGEIARAIHDPDWLQEVAPGVYELRATLVQAEGTDLNVSAPDVTTLRLADRPKVALTGNRARASFNGVLVTSWDEQAQAPDASVVGERPYVTYQNGSTFDIAGSTFQYLGSDRTGSYGVSWRRGGTTGTVTDSFFEHNFFGIYTYDAANITFARNTVQYNLRYGIDPHDNTSGLLVEANDVSHNGSHGIIFSRFVHGSLLRANYSHDNAGNGIMMDFHSDGNTIDTNLVTDNKGEGIVSSRSADLVIRNNQVSGSEVGVRLSHAGADRALVENNFITGVGTGIKVYDKAATTTISGNTIYRATVTGVLADAPDVRLVNNRVTAVPVGYDARNVVLIQGGFVRATSRALDVGAAASVALRGADLAGREKGVSVARGGVVSRAGSDVRALQPGSESSSGGGKTLSLVGALLVAAAIGLQLTHSLRNRGRPHRGGPAPAHVRNVA